MTKLTEEQKSGTIAEFFLSLSEILNVIILTIFIDYSYVVLFLILIDIINNIRFNHSVSEIIYSLKERQIYIIGNAISYLLRSIMYVYQFILIYNKHDQQEIYLFFLILLTISKVIREHSYNKIFVYFKSRKGDMLD